MRLLRRKPEKPLFAPPPDFSPIIDIKSYVGLMRPFLQGRVPPGGGPIPEDEVPAKPRVPEKKPLTRPNVSVKAARASQVSQSKSKVSSLSCQESFLMLMRSEQRQASQPVEAAESSESDPGSDMNFLLLVRSVC